MAAGRQDRHPSCSCVPTDQSFDGLWLEHCLRDHIIGHIPEDDMQVSELLGLDVLNTTARRVGTVVDVRLTVDG